MFDRHQAEITVMQFTGHSLPVHQSMSVPWDFYLVTFRQPSPPTRFLHITAIGMCHFLSVHHFKMACLAGSKVNIQQARLYQELFFLVSLIEQGLNFSLPVHRRKMCTFFIHYYGYTIQIHYYSYRDFIHGSSYAHLLFITIHIQLLFINIHI